MAALSLPDNTQASVMLLNNETAVYKIINGYCLKLGLKVITVPKGANIQKQFKLYNPGIVIVDFNYSDRCGFKVLEEMTTQHQDVPILMLSNEFKSEQAIEALKLGASDFLIKPLANNDMLHNAINRCVQRMKAAQESRRYREHLESEVHAKTTILISQLSERRRVDRALRRSELRFKSVIENATDIICTLSFEGKIVSLNKAFNKLTGYKQSTWIRRPLLEMVRHEDRQLIEHQLKNAFLGVESVEQECRIKLKNKKEMIGELIASTLIEQEEVVGVLVIIRDITDRKQAELEKQQLQLQLLQAQKLESIGRLAGGVAHDFNNALTAILGFSDLALSELSMKNPVREYVEVIKDAGEKAATLTKQLLAFGRKQILKVEHVCINSVVLRMGRMLQRLIGDDVLLHLAANARLSIVLADPAQIEQVIMNLVINARDAMPQGGELWIITENQRIEEGQLNQDSVRPGQFVVLTIRDNGAGMTEEAKSRIFEPFYTTKEPGKGTGLGLATVFGVMSQHQGFINCESELNQGTTFSAYLPVVSHEKVISTPQDDFKETLKGGDEVLLVVDDEPAIRRLLVRVLKKFGYHLLEASSGEEALEIAELQPIDLLLTDMVMPGINGKALSEKLTKINPELMTLFMSGYAQQTIGSTLPKELEDRFIQKPLKPYHVAQKIREYLDKRKVL